MKTFKSWAKRIERKFWLLKYGRFVCLRFCLLHVQPALASTKTALQQSVFLLLRLASSATIRECQNTFGTATFRIRKTNAFITLGKNSSCIFFCSKTAPPASQRLEKICTSVQLDWSRSELPHKQSSNPHPPQHTGGAPQPLRQQPRIYGFLIQQRIQKCNHQKACHTATNGLESVRPRSQPCWTLKTAHLDVHRM